MRLSQNDMSNHSFINIESDRTGLRTARQTALATLLAPILFMASLVQAAILLASTRNHTEAELIAFWLFAHCLIGGIFFLVSLREKSILFDGDANADAGPTRSAMATLLGTIWSVSPVLITPFSDVSVQTSFGAVLAGSTLAAGLMLKHLPRLSIVLLIPVTLGFLLNIWLQSDLQATIISVVVLTYFSVIAVCTRWYFARYEKKLEHAKQTDEQAQALLDMLKDLNEATPGYFWQTDQKGVLADAPQSIEGRPIGGRFSADTLFYSVFEPSNDREQLRARLERQSELIGLELEVVGHGARRWYRITGKPMFNESGFQGYRGALTDITEAKESERLISELGDYDHLTGLLNRSRLHTELDKLVQAGPRDDRILALLWLDLDNFKWVNDTLGHPAGDELLKRVTTRLKEACDPHDMIARVGGDEFAIMVQRPAEEPIFLDFIKTLTEILAEPYCLWGATAQCSASVGFRRLDASVDDTLTMFKHADLALYRSKADGRSTWSEFTREMEDEEKTRQQLVEDLRVAVDNDELSLRFQPIVDAETLETNGVEALLRWDRPSHGVIYPDAFISVAEDSGLITKIDDLVIRQAIKTAVEMPDNVRITINLSPVQMHSATLISTVEDALNRNGVAPSRLEIEITEAVLISNTDFTLERLKALKALGVSIALDDFGIGFSSLTYLRQFPFDRIKLDDSFIKDLETSEESRAIASATLMLARALGLQITAEGVETAYQRQFLLEHGCHELQGYFVCRAQPQETLSRYLGDTAHMPANDQGQAQQNLMPAANS